MPMEPDEVLARLDRLEGRIERLDARQDEQVTGLADCRRDQAVLRESLRIFEDGMNGYADTLRSLAADVSRVRDLLIEHVRSEGRDRTQMLIGVVTAALSGVGTLAVLAWGVYHLVGRLP